MKLRQIERAIGSNQIKASDGSHSARLLRIIENIQAHERQQTEDDGLVHVMSRIGVLCRGLATDLEDGHTSIEEASVILHQLADVGSLSFDAWRE